MNDDVPKATRDLTRKYRTFYLFHTELRITERCLNNKNDGKASADWMSPETMKLIEEASRKNDLADAELEQLILDKLYEENCKMTLSNNQVSSCTARTAEESHGKANGASTKLTTKTIIPVMADQLGEISGGRTVTSSDFEIHCETLSRDPLSFALYHIIPGPRKNRYYFQITVKKKAVEPLPGVTVHGFPVYVANVDTNSPVADVFRKGDRILAVNDKPPKSPEECANQLKHTSLKIHIERSYEKTAYDEQQKRNYPELLTVPAVQSAERRPSEDDESTNRNFQKLPNDVQRILQTKKNQLDEDLAQMSRKPVERSDSTGTRPVRVRIASKVIQKKIHSDVPESKSRELRRAPK